MLYPLLFDPCSMCLLCYMGLASFSINRLYGDIILFFFSFDSIIFGILNSWPISFESEPLLSVSSHTWNIGNSIVKNDTVPINNRIPMKQTSSSNFFGSCVWIKERRDLIASYVCMCVCDCVWQKWSISVSIHVNSIKTSENCFVSFAPSALLNIAGRARPC